MTKHTDTIRSGDLVERLRDFVIAEDIDAAADRIEALEAEIERLREALREADYLADYWFTKHETLRDAIVDILGRAALGEKQ